MIRLASEGPAFYDAVLERIAERDEKPRGIELHFSGARGGEFIVGTLFRDRELANAGFINFVAPETARETAETGNAVDLTRDVYEIIHIHVSDAIEGETFRAAPADGLVASFSDNFQISTENYWELVGSEDWSDSVAAGRVAHLAYSDGENVHSINFWTSREAGEQWYRQRGISALEELQPGDWSEEKMAATWVDLHTFVVTAEPGSEMRDFRRRGRGPQDSQSGGLEV